MTVETIKYDKAKSLQFSMRLNIVIFLIFGGWVYFSAPTGLPCEITKNRTGILVKGKNTVYLNDGKNLYVISWPVGRSSHEGPWDILNAANDGAHVEDFFCKDTMVRVLLEKKEIYLITSDFERRQRLTTLKLIFFTLVLLIIAHTAISYRIKNLKIAFLVQ